MFIFYGLGNNSLEYLQTKHNLGRLVIEELSKIWELEFCSQKSYYFCKTSIDENKLFLLYSSGFMNNSGVPLLDLIQYFKLQNSIKLLVILQDDSDQLEGNFKLLPKGGSAGHRGIDSIYQYIETLKIPDKNILCLKIGIRPINNKQKNSKFLSKY